jgi:hypothetical protein
MNSKDVRRMRICCLCQTVGVHRPISNTPLPIVISIHSDRVPKKRHKFVHPICYLEEMGIGNLLILDYRELQHIRMCDVPMYAMIKLLKQRTFGITPPRGKS